MRNIIAASLLILIVGLGFARAPEPPRIDPETGLMEEPAAPKSMGKTPQPPSEAYVEWQNSQAPWLETDAQWGDVTRLTTNTVIDYPAYYGREAVAVDPSGRVHVVWFSYQGGTYTPQIFYKRFYPGTGWTADTCISADLGANGSCWDPTIAVDSAGNVHVVFAHNRVTPSPTGWMIGYKMCTPTASGNGGWQTTTTRINEDTLLWTKRYPAIATTPNGNVHVAWYTYHSTLGYAIAYKERVGTTWQPRVWVDSASTSIYMMAPDIAGSRNNDVHVVWFGYRPGATTYYQAWYRGRFAGTWGSHQNASKWNYFCYYPSIAVNPVNNRPAVTYWTYTLPNYWYLIAFKERLGSGNGASDTWPNAYEGVNDTLVYPVYTYGMCLTYTKNGRAHVVWAGYASQTQTYYGVLHNERSPAGVWDWPPTVVFYQEPYYQVYPSINNGGSGADSLSVHVVWSGNVPGNYEMYYRKGMPPPPNDIGVSRIVSPDGMVGQGTVQPAAYVKNYGTAPQSNFQVKMDIGTVYTSTVTVTNTINPGESLLVNTFAPWSATSGTYVVRCSTRLTGDGNPANDRRMTTVTVMDWMEFFEATNGNYRGTGGWEWGTPSGGSRPPARSGIKVWGNKLSGNYSDNARDSLISCRLIATQNNPVIMFFHWMYCETYWDGGGVYYSTDDGATWTLMYPDTTGGRRPYYGTLSTGHIGWSGSIPNWEVARFNVPVTNGTAFRIMWLFTSDASVNYNGGWMIDDVAGLGCRLPIDVGVSEILAPTGSIPYGVPVTPQAKVKNFGSGQQTFPVEFRIGTVYVDTQDVSLAPGESAVVSFANWTPSAKGTYTTRVRTMLSGDEVPGNDTISGSVDVYLFDVQPTEIIRPKGDVDSGTVIAPQVRVRNNGSSVVSFYVRLKIGSAYNHTRLVVGLNPDEVRTVTGFPNWVANELGDFEVRCTTELTGDMITSNDLLIDSVHVHRYDVAATAIVSPSGTVYVNDVITPTVRVANYGDLPATFDVRYVIYDSGMNPVYEQTEEVALDAGAETDHAFSATWTATPIGSYLAVAWVAMSRDQNRANDTVQLPFEVRVRYVSGWAEMAPLITEARDGGFLAKDLDAGNIYAASGGKSGNFYSYSVDANNWTSLTSAPFAFAKGGNGCYGGGYVYAMAGGNKPDFGRYNVATGTWEPLTPIPGGTSGKNPKGGGDMVYVVLNDTGYVYLLKGGKQDFMRYNTQTATWESLPPAPAGGKAKWDKGSWLVYDGESKIYAHKAKLSELWVFDLTTGQWASSAEQGIPTSSTKTGKNKKSKDGSDGAYYEGFIYALKGGNTCELWKYDVANKTWTELDPMPEVGTTGKKKRIKGGGALVSNGDGALFALKGAKTKEFWRFFEGLTAFASAPERSGVMGQTVTPVRFGFNLAPNPVVKGYGLLSYSVPQAGEARVKVFDVTGRTVAEFGFVASGTGTRSLDLRHLAAGVYLVQFEAAGNSASQKLIVR